MRVRARARACVYVRIRSAAPARLVGAYVIVAASHRSPEFGYTTSGLRVCSLHSARNASIWPHDRLGGGQAAESRRRFRRAPAQMWMSFRADVGESRRRCGCRTVRPLLLANGCTQAQAQAYMRRIAAICADRHDLHARRRWEVRQ